MLGEIEGSVDLFEREGELHISGTLQGLGRKYAKHGFHVHTEGKIGK